MTQAAHSPELSAGSALPGAEVAFLSVKELASAFRGRALSPVEVARMLLDRIDTLDPLVNATVYQDRTTTLAMAEAAEKRYARGAALSALDGVPITIKDLSAVAGWPYRRGSLTLDPAIPCREDTPCVARLREAGAVFLAKTATPEFGCKVVTRSPVHGVTANPYNLSRTPGGSSGGASAALALGFGPLAVGSDGAGSVRIPASSTNVFGLKPGFGRVPAFPPDIDMPHSVVGPMARAVADAALMLDVISRPEPRDPFAWPIPFVLPGDLQQPDLFGFRIAVSARLGCTAPLVDAEVDALVAGSGPLLAAAGADVENASPLWPVDPLEPFAVFWDATCVAAVNAVAPGLQPRLDPLLHTVAALGRAIDLGRFHRALEQRMAISAASKSFFNQFDLLVGPVMPVPPFQVERDAPEGFADEDWSWCPYTYVWNMTGQPAASVPIGFTASGLPVGVQIIGRLGAEADVLRAAAAIEQQRPLHRQHPVIATESHRHDG